MKPRFTSLTRATTLSAPLTSPLALSRPWSAAVPLAALASALPAASRALALPTALAARPVFPFLPASPSTRLAASLCSTPAITACAALLPRPKTSQRWHALHRACGPFSNIPLSASRTHRAWAARGARVRFTSVPPTAAAIICLTSEHQRHRSFLAAVPEAAWLLSVRQTMATKLCFLALYGDSTLFLQ
jgi:hypothetical protein